LALSLALAGGGYLYTFWADPMSFIGPGEGVDPGETSEEGREWPHFGDKFDDKINIAFLGFDSDLSRQEDDDVFRPDTIMVASLDFENQEVSLLSIPRDSYVEIYGTGSRDKINHAYYHGHRRATGEEAHEKGIETQLNTVQEVIGGIPLHYYVSLDMDGVVEIVNHLGGIEYELEYPAYRGLGTDREVALEAGLKELSGKEYLRVARCRYHGGDVGRVERQQELLQTTVDQLPDRVALSNIPSIYRSVQDHVETDLELMEIMTLARFGYENLDVEKIDTYVMPGHADWKYIGGQNISYLVIDESARVDTIKEAFGVEVEKREQISLPGRINPKKMEAKEAIDRLPTEFTLEDLEQVKEVREKVELALADGVDEEDIKNLDRLLEAEEILRELEAGETLDYKINNISKAIDEGKIDHASDQLEEAYHLAEEFGFTDEYSEDLEVLEDKIDEEKDSGDEDNGDNDNGDEDNGDNDDGDDSDNDDNDGEDNDDSGNDEDNDNGNGDNEE